MKHPIKLPVLALCAVVLLLALSVGFWGCLGHDDPVAVNESQETAAFSVNNPAVRDVMAIQDRHTSRLMADPDVIGTATTLTDDGRLAIMVLATSRRAIDALPAELDGVPVRPAHTDPIVAVKGSGVSHTAKQSFPIQLGTSGGNRFDIANGYCCGGTLGSLVQGGGKRYILSNSHVFVGDVVSGGNGRVAQIGDPIIQPGLIDVGCVAANANDVANVSTLSTIYPPNSTPNIDASLAEEIVGRVSSAILEIGNISSSTVAASVNQQVKKSGRTTGLTRSKVSGLNATVNVGYSTECAGSSFTKQFTGQILVTNRGSRFLNSGDSGSLMVEDVTTTPRAVGLLYAGSSSIAVANPINHVLSHFNVTMVP